MADYKLVPVELLKDWHERINTIAVETAFNVADEIESMLYAAPQPAPRVPEGWRTAREGKDWPRIGEKYLIRIGPDLVMQHEVFEFDQGDDGNGGGEFFWGRDDIDECPAFDSENDEWLPLSAMLTATPAVQVEPVTFCEDAALSIAEQTFSTEVDEQLASDITRYAQRLHSLYATYRKGGEV